MAGRLFQYGETPRAMSWGDPAGDELAETTLQSSVTQYGITWTFDQEYPVGQFVNDDYFVIGPVTIDSVSPAPTTTVDGYDIHGSMLNPTGSQAYDSRTTAYGSPYDELGRLAYPASISAGSSIVSTESVDPTLASPRPALQKAAVLTVLSEAPVATAFRPTYMGSTKTIYDAANINWSLLPNLALPSGQTEPDPSYYADLFQRPWILHNGDWTTRHVSPIDNQPSYHRNIALPLSHAAVAMISNLSVDKTQMVKNYIQLAIDYYGMHLYAQSPRYNYRWPTIFAGIMLQDDRMRDMWLLGENGYEAYSDPHVYYWEDHTRTTMSEIIPLGETWTYYNQNYGKIAVFSRHGDPSGDATEHEHLHPTEWPWIEDAGYSGGGDKQETYRQMHSSYLVGETLASLAMNARTAYDRPVLLDYTDRWMTETVEDLEAAGGGANNPYVPQTSTNDFVDAMWNLHRSSY